MNKNKIEIIEINDDYEQAKLNNSNIIIQKENEFGCEEIYLKNISKTFLLYIIIFLIIIIILLSKKIIFLKKKQNGSSSFFSSPYSSSSFYSPSSSKPYLIDNKKYFKLNKYDKKAVKIYSSTGTISFNLLEELSNITSKKNLSNYNHIHVAMSFDDNYHLLSSVTIASLLKNAKKSTYIHLHIIAVDNFKYPIMKKLYSLKSKINNNTEFIFHNGDKALKDFGKNIKKESQGIPEYARFLAPYFAKDTDRIIVTDSADLIIKKDLLELYNFPLEDKIVKGSIDPYTKCFPDYIFFHKENYFNGGVLLFNSKKWRELNLYQDILNFYKGFKYKGKLPTPIQDILNTFFPAISLGLLPLKYNFQGYVNLNEEDYFPENEIYELECSLFYHKKKKLIKHEKNVVIRHSNKYKVYTGEASYNIKSEWEKYAKLTGFYEEICQQYPLACQFI